MVKLFTSTTCSQCPTVKKYLKLKGIEYEEISIDTTKGLKEFLKLSDRFTVPFLTDGQRVVYGFQPSQIGKLG